MIRRLLIANRGEIACRIIRTCRQMGITTIAVYSDADRHALHVELADEAIYIGGHHPAESYLNLQAVLDAIERSAADAVHPGYGFLAENARFAYMMEAIGVTFVGPRGGAIEAMGDKAIAKSFLMDVPLIPGYLGDDQRDAAFLNAASAIGYPLMVKASAGGGGKGMRLVQNADELPQALAAARREAQSAFGDDTLLLEKALIKPRHIEVQIIGDQYDHIIALGERECTIQRRHQKIIEESPAHGLDPDVRQAMHNTAVNAARQLGYHNAGTVEFLLDHDNNFYFIEMNTRLQVEHPVTEAVYALDLVRWQIELADGTPLADLLPPYASMGDFAYAPDGHAIEARLYAEDPTNQFLPTTGDILYWQAPPHVRVDAGIRTGDTITPYYDPMVAKIIAHGASRDDAIRRLDYALAQTALLGIRSNIAFLRRTLNHESFVEGVFSTDFVAEHAGALTTPAPITPLVMIAAALARHGHESQHWRNNPNRPIKHQFAVGAPDGGEERHDIFLTPKAGLQFSAAWQSTIYPVELLSVKQHVYTIDIDGYIRTVRVHMQDSQVWVHTDGNIYHLRWVSPLPEPVSQAQSRGSLRAPMPGQVIDVAVEIGQSVHQGDLLLIIEAMKMEHRIEAPHDGTVQAIYYAVGDAVQTDDVLVSIANMSEE